MVLSNCLSRRHLCRSKRMGYLFSSARMVRNISREIYLQSIQGFFLLIKVSNDSQKKLFKAPTASHQVHLQDVGGICAHLLLLKKTCNADM